MCGCVLGVRGGGALLLPGLRGVTECLEVLSSPTPSQEVRPQAVTVLELSYSSPPRKRAVSGVSSGCSWAGGRGRVFLREGVRDETNTQEGFLEGADSGVES